MGRPQFFLISPLSPLSLLAEDLARVAQECYGISSYWTQLPAPASTDFARRRHIYDFRS